MRQLEITTSLVCGIDCSPVCPQKKFRVAYGPNLPKFLSLENFKHVIDYLPEDVTLSFAGFSEPMLNQDCLEMIEYAREKSERRIEIYSTLVGLTPTGIDRLVKVKLDRFVLHLQEPNNIAHIPINSQNQKDTVWAALCKLQIQHFSVMNDSFLQDSRAGNCDNMKPRKLVGPLYCNKLIEPQFVMLPDCSIVLCCEDWQLKHKLGNLLESSFDEIQNSEAFKTIQKNRWAIHGKTLCRGCGMASPAVLHYAVEVQKGLVQFVGKPVRKLSGFSPDHRFNQNE